MPDIDWGKAIAALNATAFVAFSVVLGGLVSVLGRRLFLYRRAGWAIPALLKRNLIFFGGLGGLIGEAIILRQLGGDLFTGDTLLRFAFVLHYDIISILLFVYYLKVEAMDVQDPKDDDQ